MSDTSNSSSTALEDAGSQLSILDRVPENMRQYIHPHWAKFPPVEPTWHYVFGSIYILLGITSITGNYFNERIVESYMCLTVFLIGNSLVLYLYLRTKELRTPANSFVVNLAVSDFSLMIVQSPMFVVNCFAGGVWQFGPFWCKLYAFAGLVFGICSICTMAAISYDRYNIIVNGMNGTRMTLRKAVKIILFCWTYAMGWSLPPFFGWGNYIPEGILVSCSFDYLARDELNLFFIFCLFLFDYCIPLLIIVYCYFHIVKAIFHHERALREQAKKMNRTSLRTNSYQNNQSGEMRIAKVALVNIALWVAMWTPYAAIVLQGAVGNQDVITPFVTLLPTLIAKSASIANPIIYAISHPKYRLALKKTVPCFKRLEVLPIKSSNSANMLQTTLM